MADEDQSTKLLSEVIQGGNPLLYSDPTGMTGQMAPAFSPGQLATPEAINAAMAYGGRPTPQVASSGPDGGWFGNVPISGQGQETFGSPTYYQGAVGIPQGLQGPSTNNWRLLPPAYRSPNYRMQAGHIIDNYWTPNNDYQRPLAYAGYRGAQGAPFALGGPGHGYPTSIGSPTQRGYFFTGQIDPWLYEGGAGTT